jgi:hypothetical protein
MRILIDRESWAQLSLTPNKRACEVGALLWIAVDLLDCPDHQGSNGRAGLFGAAAQFLVQVSRKIDGRADHAIIMAYTT